MHDHQLTGNGNPDVFQREHIRISIWECDPRHSLPRGCYVHEK